MLQDTFIRAFRQASRFDPQLGTPFSWLATIGKRQAIDWLRRERRRPEILSAETEQPQEITDKSQLDERARLHDHVEGAWLREALGGLAPGQREVIELAFFEGFTHVEIADALNRPLGTVKSDLRRGLLQLKKQVTGKR
jgi:RNA polymerase sigma-70 factor (ECF subfamily)